MFIKPKKKYWITGIAPYYKASGGSMAFDATTQASQSSGGTTMSWSHTAGISPTAVAVALENFDAAIITGVTYGGHAMALAGATQTISGTSSSVQIWGLTNLTGLSLGGTQTIVITCSSSPTFMQAWATTVTGSNVTTCFDAYNSATAASGTTASVSVTSASGEIVVDVVGNTSGATETVGGTQTQNGTSLTVSTNVASSSRLTASGASTSMSWTLGSSVAWGIAAASFKQ